MNLVIGAIIAILTTIFVESMKKPRLSLQIAVPDDNEYTGRPANKTRFLALNLHNRALPAFAKWLLRAPALQCNGTISFHHMDGQNVFGRGMQIRWSKSPQPIPSQVNINGQLHPILDPRQLTPQTSMHVYPGESERLDVAGKFDDESECYGWSNDNYFSNPVWRDPRWRLPKGRYLVKVLVISSGEKCEGIFRLINDVPLSDFRLEPAMKGDSVRE